MLFFFAKVVLGSPAISAPDDANEIETRMKRVVEYLDSPGYESAVSWEDYLVHIYRYGIRREWRHVHRGAPVSKRESDTSRPRLGDMH